MPLTEPTYCEKVRRLAMQRGRRLELSDIRDFLPNVLTMVSREIAMSGEYPLSQKEYTLAMVGGKIDLSAETTILLESIDTVLHPTAGPDGGPDYLSRIPDGNRSDLKQPRGEFYNHYIIENKAIYAGHGNGVDVPPDDANCVVEANPILAINEIPVQWEDRAIEIGAQTSPGAKNL